MDTTLLVNSVVWGGAVALAVILAIVVIRAQSTRTLEKLLEWWENNKSKYQNP